MCVGGGKGEAVGFHGSMVQIARTGQARVPGMTAAAVAEGRNDEACGEAEVEGDKKDCKREGDGGLHALCEGPVDSQDAAYDHLDWMLEFERESQGAAAVVSKVQNPGSCQEV